METETVTFIVEQDLPKGETHLDKDKERSWSLLGKIGNILPETHTSKPTLDPPETVTYVVERELPKAELKLDIEKETMKPTVASESITFLVEQELPKVDVELDKDKDRSWGLLGKIGGLTNNKDVTTSDVEPERVTFVVEHDLPKTEVKLDKKKEHSGSFLGKIESSLPEKEAGKPSSQPDIVTFVVDYDLPKGKVDLDKDKERSWSLLGKFGGSHSEKQEDSKIHSNVGARPRQQEVVVDAPQYYTEETSWKPFAKKTHIGLDVKGSASLEESLTITVSTEDEAKNVQVLEDKEKEKTASLKWSTVEKKEKKRKFQQEVIVDDTHLHMDEGGLKVKPGFGGQLKGSGKIKGTDSEESMTFVVKDESQVVAKAAPTAIPPSKKPEKHSSKTNLEPETVTFVVEHEVPKTEVQLSKEKGHSWSLLHKIGGLIPEKDINTANAAESETVTYVVEQELPEIEADRGKDKEHSWGLTGKIGGIFPEKHTSKTSLEPPETMTYVVERELSPVDVKLDKEKEYSPSLLEKIGSLGSEKDAKTQTLEPESVTFVVEHDLPKSEVKLDKEKEHSWSLLGKIGSMVPDKDKAKTPLKQETVTFIVEQDLPKAEGGLHVSVGKEKPGISEMKRSMHQEEMIVDDAHVFSDEADRKWKLPKASDLIRKKELELTEPSSESVTFVVSGKPLAEKEQKKAPALHAVNGEGKETGETQETITFVVKELPAGEVNIGKSISPLKTDQKKVSETETVTFIVEDEPLNMNDGETLKREAKHHVLLDKTSEIKPQLEKVYAGSKPRDAFQEEVIIDDTHLYSDKSEKHWSPFAKKSQQPPAGEVKTSVGIEAKVEKPSFAERSPETVTYTVTSVVEPDQESREKVKGKQPHKWTAALGGKKKGGDQSLSTSEGSLPSSAEKNASLQRRRRQEELVVGEKMYVTENQGIITSIVGGDDKRKAATAGGKPKELEIKVMVEHPSVNGTPSTEIPKVLMQKEVTIEQKQSKTETPKEATEEVAQFKFDLGNVTAIENIKQKYLESPEPKKIVVGTDQIKGSVRHEVSKKTGEIESQVNGFQDAKQVMTNGVSSTEHVENFDHPEESNSKRIRINFDTSTPKKEVAVLSTGAHGHELQHAVDVSVSNTSLSVPQAGIGYDSFLDTSIDSISLPSSSRPTSFYVQPVSSSSSGPPPQHFVVIAIDFGTTFSGYAFSFSRDIDSIHVMRKWPDGDPGIVNQKTPTVLLLTSEGKFHSFGFTAKDFYHNLTPKEAMKWMYFEKFKMALHYNADLTSSTEIHASSGQSFPALTVFSHALRFFKDHALQEVSDQSATRILNEDVRWVITVPAIWKAPAKQFMRQAAYQAGIASPDNPEQLIIALEPEAASVFIRKQRLQQLIPEYAETRPVSPKKEATPEPVLIDRVSQVYNKQDTNRWSQTLPSDTLSMSFQRSPSPIYTQVRVGEELNIAGTRYMVADCGGGTVDITVYEMNSESGKLAEIYKATGGPYGSMGVDLEFEALLIEIFGSDFIDVFKAKRPAGWVDLMMAFESRKRAATPFKSNPLNVPLPFSFMDYHKKFRNNTVESAIRKYGNKDVRWSSQGMMRVMPDAMNRLFQPTLNKIKEAIGNVLNNPSVKGIKYLFLVGGFAESPMLQVEMRNEFSQLVKILIPADASLAILKGAVCFGCDPGVVTVRKSRMSYGLAVLNRFIHGKHPETKLAYKDGVEWCLDIFDHLVFADQSVALGTSVVRSYTPAGPTQKFGNFDIYCSDNKEVQYVTDPGVQNCGTIRLDLSDLPQEESGSRRREVQARLTFGDTEIKVVALDVATGNSVRAAIDFLNK